VLRCGPLCSCRGGDRRGVEDGGGAGEVARREALQARTERRCGDKRKFAASRESGTGLVGHVRSSLSSLRWNQVDPVDRLGVFCRVMEGEGGSQGCSGGDKGGGVGEG